MTRKSVEHTLHDHVQLVLQDYFNELGDQKPTQLHGMIISEVERALFKSILTYAKNNHSKAAVYLGLSRGTLRKKLREYGLDNDT